MVLVDGPVGVTGEGSAETPKSPNAESSSTGNGVDCLTSSVQSTSPSMKVHLRPVSQPSSVTLLFEYAVKAWGNQKGDHCTYRYLPSREPGSHTNDMIASVLVRLPNKQPLMVRDTEPRASRVSAQNAVAQLALDKLAVDDPQLAEELEVLRKEAAAYSYNYQKYSSQPYNPWNRRNYYHQQQHQFYGYFPEGIADEFVPQDSMVYYQMIPPIMTGPMETAGVNPLIEEGDALITPTIPYAPFGYGYSPMPYMPPEMMYYPPHVMMGAAPAHQTLTQDSEGEKQQQDSS